MPETKKWQPTDYFSKQAAEYAQYRPKYPKQLLSDIIQWAGKVELVWDIATGNGQAANGIAELLLSDNKQSPLRVVATDMSASQLQHADKSFSCVDYRVAWGELLSDEEWKVLEEQSNDIVSKTIDEALMTRLHIQPKSVDLVTIATALHWLHAERHFKVVERALRPGGIYASWCYTMDYVFGSHRLNQLLAQYFHKIVGPYWPKEREFVMTRYATIPMPSFDPVGLAPLKGHENPVSGPDYSDVKPCEDAWHSPNGQIPFVHHYQHVEFWTLSRFFGYLQSWSSTQRAQAAMGHDPMDSLRSAFTEAWENDRDEVNPALQKLLDSSMPVDSLTGVQSQQGSVIRAVMIPIFMRVSRSP